mmetsp:Transcript_28762/g.44170  ORF Transcript_28762/g.44170 Transcript_28762/m.44170 type:complete len:204 (-) Transcript_28762:513-1124(-)
MKFPLLSTVLLGAILLFAAAPTGRSCAFPTPCSGLDLEVDGFKSVALFSEHCSAEDDTLGLDTPVWFSFVAPYTGCVMLDYDIYLPLALSYQDFANVEMFVYESEGECNEELRLVEYNADFFGLNIGPFFSGPRIIGRNFTPEQTYYGALDVEMFDDTTPATFSGKVRAKPCSTQCPGIFPRPHRWVRCMIFGYYFPGIFSFF